MLYILLPAYNEEHALPLLLASIRQMAEKHKLDSQIIVVDDGSSDRTAEIARAGGARVLIHPRNMGLAAGLGTGLGTIASMAHPDDIIVTMDADNTHNPHLIPRMIQYIDEGFDVVIASRYCPGAHIVGVPQVRQLLSDMGGWVYRLLLPIPGVRDYTCGYRAYRAAILQAAFERWGDQFISEKGFTAMADILFKLRCFDNLLVIELPFILRYDRKSGASKMHVGSNVIASLRLAIRRALGRLD